MRRVPVVVAACIAVALVVTQTACSDSQGPSPSPPPYDPPTEVTTPAVVPTFETLWTDETYCPETHPVPMGMVPESSDDEEVLRYLAVCTTEPTTGFPDGKGFYIKNYDKAAVWILDAPTLHWTNPDLQPLDLQVYRENLADLGMAGLTVEPGQSLRNTDSDPMRLHMRLDGQRSSHGNSWPWGSKRLRRRVSTACPCLAVRCGGGHPHADRRARAGRPAARSVITNPPGDVHVHTGGVPVWFVDREGEVERRLELHVAIGLVSRPHRERHRVR